MSVARSPYDPCDSRCWTPVPCPKCGSDLPPRGRAMPLEMCIPDCCDDARMDPAINPRHMWSAGELDDLIGSAP